MEAGYYLWCLLALLSSMFLRRLLTRATAVPGMAYLVPKGVLQGKDHFLQFKLAERFEISTDSRIFRFELPDEQPLGLALCHHLLIKVTPPGQTSPAIRKYTPISKINDYGFFDLLVKVYFKETRPEYPAGGLVSQVLEGLKVGDMVEMAGPVWKHTYKGNGLFEIKTEKGLVERRVRHLGLIAGGTGITPFFQIIQYVAMTRGEDLNISLVYGNESEAGILLRQELEEFVAEQKLHLYLTVDSPQAGWTGGRGLISREMLQERLPPPDKDVLICHCGSKPMNQHVRRLLTELGYAEDTIVKF